MPAAVDSHLTPGEMLGVPAGRSLRSNFVWTLTGNVVYAASQWGLLIILAKVGTPELVGRFALALAVTTPVMTFSNLQLRAVLATDSNNDYSFREYIAARLFTTVLALGIIIGIILISGYAWETFSVVFTIAVAKCFESISDVLYGLFQLHERMDFIATSMMLKGPLSLIALGVTVYKTGSLLAGTIALALTWGILLMAYDAKRGASVLRARSLEQHAPKFRPVDLCHSWSKKTTALMRLAFPLGLVMMLISLNTNIPRYFVERCAGTRALGIFAALAYLMAAGGTVVSAMGQSASPRLAKYYAARDAQRFKTLLLQLIAIGAVIGLAGVGVALLAGQQVLTPICRAEYAGHVSVFVLLMISSLVSFLASFLGSAMTAARYFKIQMPLFVVVSAITRPPACGGLSARPKLESTCPRSTIHIPRALPSFLMLRLTPAV